MNTTYEAQRTAAEKIIDKALKGRVLRGLDLLKEEYGENWVEHIDPERLNLRDSQACVLGQVEDATVGGDFESAVRRIDGDLEDKGATHFGFDGGSDEWGGDDDWFDYPELTEAWLIVIGEDE